jgi:septum formation protein
MLREDLKNYKLILASNSPRRQSLMKEAGLNFELRIPPEISEDYPANMQADTVPHYLAKIKASTFEGQLENNEIVITADTVVILSNRVLGKPKDLKDAFKMLNSLSGRKHEVITAVCFKSKFKEKIFSATSEVWFRKLSEQEINYYIHEFKPYDKAGAYGIQEWIGYIGVERIEGSFFNVMGLPIQMVYVELEKFIGS